MRALLVQPWIADVAAYNFWIRPLGLYAVAEWISERGGEVRLIDCLSPTPAPGKFLRAPVPTPPALQGLRRRFCRYGIDRETFAARIRAAAPFDAVFVTSSMSYWYPGVQWAIQDIRAAAPGVPVILGGVYPTLWPGHARAHSGADHVFSGPVDGPSGAALADTLGLPCEPVRPHRPWYRLGLHDGASYAAVRTARGCPYRCTYCASARLSGDFSPSSPDQVVSELRWLAAQGVREVSFYDDALLVDFAARLQPILAAMKTSGCRLRFHTPNGLHARLITPEVAHWLARSGFQTVRLSLETVNPERQRLTGNKVANEDVARAVRALLEAGMPPDSIGVYLLFGLPCQDIEEVREGLRHVQALGVRVRLCEYSPIPGTEEWNRLPPEVRAQLEAEPLLTNNSVYFRRFGAYPPRDVERLLMAVRTSNPA